jgi:formylglycine-generating enzyme required for sulfatase activity
MEEHAVTVADFRRFVRSTGYVTVAEKPPVPEHFPEADPASLVPGALVFTPPTGPVPLDDFRGWWQWVPGASWAHPEGPDSDVSGRDRHPVTQVAYDDAAAYAAWAGKDLPTEAEWERAARGGLAGATFVWGDEFSPKGRMLANTWQGRFPWENLCLDGWAGTSPVKSFPPNGYGLYEMAGNVWEWTTDFFSYPQGPDGDAGSGSCCAPRNPRVSQPGPDALARGEHYPSRVIKGGSHLCAPNYCLRYRPAARQAESEDTATTHIGFRCVSR